MGLPITPSAVLGVTLHFDLNGDANVRSKLYFAYTGSPPANADCNTIASAAATAVGAHLAALYSNTINMFEVDVVDLATVNGGVGEWTGAEDGSLTGGVLPVENCLLMNHKISRKYRGGKPRSYFPWGDETKLNSDGRTWASAFLSTVNTDYAAFITAMAIIVGGSTDVAGPVNVSYYQGYNPPTIVNNRAKNHPKLRATPVVDPITASTANIVVAAQRRRIGR